MIINEVNVIERGWPGHFMFADKCIFRRNTLLEYKGIKWIVSTVGNYRNSKNRIDSIGHCRWYETMAYEAKEKNGFIEADVEKKIFFDSKCGIWGDSWEEVCKNCNDTPDNAANDMHNNVVSELIDKIKEQYNLNLTKAIEIEIVKQDDISDDMCEWRKFKGNGCLFETSCSNVSGMYRGFNFCPYCGKKIKEY